MWSIGDEESSLLRHHRRKSFAVCARHSCLAQDNFQRYEHEQIGGSHVRTHSNTGDDRRTPLYYELITYIYYIIEMAHGVQWVFVLGH